MLKACIHYKGVEAEFLEMLWIKMWRILKELKLHQVWLQHSQVGKENSLLFDSPFFHWLNTTSQAEAPECWPGKHYTTT